MGQESHGAGATTGSATGAGHAGADAAPMLIERARRVLLHEQRTGHADTAVKPGGLEAFITHWMLDVRAARERGEIARESSRSSGPPPEDAIGRLLVSYNTLDPMQRAAKLRAALALLDAIKGARGKPSAPPRLAKPHATTPAKETLTRTRVPAEAPPGPSAPHAPVAPIAPRAADDAALAKAAALPALRAASAVRDPILARPRPATRAEDAYLLSAPITAAPLVGATQAARLLKLGVETVRDLLFTFPREHHDYSTFQKIDTLEFNAVSTIMGIIWDVETQRLGASGGRTKTIATIRDETGSIRASWFNQPYLLKQLPRNAYIVLTGTKQRFGNKVEFSVRAHELPEQSDLTSTGRLVPVYPLTEGLSPKMMRRFTKWAVDHCAGFVPDHLPAALRARANLLPLPQAIAQMHYPENQAQLDAARRRLAFDELFLIQLGMLTRRANWRDGPQAPSLVASESLIFAETEQQGEAEPDAALTLGGGLWPISATCFERSLPFRFTNAQRRALREILADMRRPQAMCRLLQGDVGSGKTVVAAAALLATAANGYQGTLLAPTEILAEQHHRGLSALLAPFGLQVALLTGSMRAKERTAARDALASGAAVIAIGTHALIQEDVTFHKLGLVVVDEQHRFGVEQRDALRQKGHNPHMLVMTATPIPRTLALTLYGDLDVSTLDELPAGRQPIITRWRAGAQRNEAYRLVAEEVEQGRQAYIICPLVEESESLEAKSAIKEYERLQADVFPQLQLGLAHGQLRPAEKDRVMRAFRDGEIDILVATAVVEVGVDVPNATVMLIEDADRFGLSQLHQFRGRVGRGKQQSYCYLLSQEASLMARERLSVLERTTDGFLLAEEDLRLRGPGDFFGTRQSGLPELRIAKLADTALLMEARQQAEWLWERDPYLRSLEHAPLRERVFLFWQAFMAH